MKALKYFRIATLTCGAAIFAMTLAGSVGIEGHDGVVALSGVGSFAALKLAHLV